MGMLRAILSGIIVAVAIAVADKNVNTSITPEDDKLGVLSVEESSPPTPPKRWLIIPEDTPVWVAHRPNRTAPLEYTKYRNKIVKDAMFGIKRSMGEYLHSNIVPQNETSTFERSPLEPAEISFLVVMDYKAGWKLDLSLEDYIKKQIRYAAAFWNAINIQLRNVRDPMLRLRLAGIIIGRNKEAMPYLRESETGSGMNTTKALRGTSLYWRILSKNNPDFPSDSYHAVAVMTDSEPNTDRYWSYYAHGALSLTFLFNDDLWFRSLPSEGGAMNEIGDVLQGYSEVQLKQYGHLSTGEPIQKTILPGHLYSTTDHCRAAGWEKNSRICVAAIYEDTPCRDVRCLNPHWLSNCVLTGRPLLIGSECNSVKKDNTKMCLENECRDIPPGFM